MVALRRALFAPLLALALLLPLTVVAAPPASAGAGANAVLADINASRKAAGLKPLRMRTDLNRYAGKHTYAMIARGRLSHTSLSRSGLCCWRRLGENVAYAGSISAAHNSLMRSAGHRANILSRYYDEVGIGYVKRGGTVWITQVFRDRR
jgi:uncharacterized protein YkwD